MRVLTEHPLRIADADLAIRDGRGDRIRFEMGGAPTGATASDSARRRTSGYVSM
jgi:hypothetical protein